MVEVNLVKQKTSSFYLKEGFKIKKNVEDSSLVGGLNKKVHIFVFVSKCSSRKAKNIF